ncbi:MAG: glycosyltransferase family 4 protein [Alphaproteobacteria bacterium]
MPTAPTSRKPEKPDSLPLGAPVLGAPETLETVQGGDVAPSSYQASALPPVPSSPTPPHPVQDRPEAAPEVASEATPEAILEAINNSLSPRPRLAIIVKGYPRLSETFIAQELAGLGARGLSYVIVSLRRPTDKNVHLIHNSITAPVVYLPEYLHQEPWRVFKAWRTARRLPGYAKAKVSWLKDLRRDWSRNRIRRFGQALVLATEMSDFGPIDHLYVHFLHTPASVARYTAQMREISWSASAHAKDIWTTPAWEKREKLADAAWVTTCTAAGLAHLQDFAPPGPQDRVFLTYHGLDFRRFPPPPLRPARDGLQSHDPVQILSVGRLVPKKGYDDVLQALALLPSSLNVHFIHIGGGRLGHRMHKLARRLGIADRITWRGAATSEAVLKALRAADLFVLAPKIAPDGDRDGLPNVLLEAQSQGLACVSTTAAAVSELIIDRETGLLVPPSAPAALAQALERLIRDPVLRQHLGAAGNTRVRTVFSASAGIDFLAQKLRNPGLPSATPARRAR